MATVDSRLDVGLSYSDYSEIVGEASVFKGMVDEDIVADIDYCASAHSGAEFALLTYSLAASRWNDCIFDDYDCEVDDLDLSSSWVISGNAVEAAQTALVDRTPIDPDSEIGQLIDVMNGGSDSLSDL